MSPGRWWSVTITSTPSSFARATSATAVMPQSTVRRRPTPSVASRSTVSSAMPYPSSKRLGRCQHHVGAGFTQRQHGDRGGADPVDVVVAVHADLLSGCDRGLDPLHCGGHVAEEKRVVTGRLGGQKDARRCGVAVPAAREHGGGDLAHAELAGELEHRLAVTLPDRPAPVLHRASTVRSASDVRPIPPGRMLVRRRLSRVGVPPRPALVAELQDDLHPEHDDADRRADDHDGDRREERHLRQRVAGHRSPDEPDGQHGGGHGERPARLSVPSFGRASPGGRVRADPPCPEATLGAWRGATRTTSPARTT